MILLLIQTTQTKIRTFIMTHIGLQAPKAEVQFYGSWSMKNFTAGWRCLSWGIWRRADDINGWGLCPLKFAFHLSQGQSFGPSLIWRILFLLRKQILIGPLTQTMSIFYDLSFNYTGNSNVSSVSNLHNILILFLASSHNFYNWTILHWSVFIYVYL